MSSVNLHGKQFVTPEPDRPRAVELADNAVLALKGCVARVVACAVARVATLIKSLWDVCGTHAAHRLHFSKKIINHMTPVAEHIDDDPAAILLPVIPRGPLRGLIRIFPGKNPIPKPAPHAQDSPEKSLVVQRPEFSDSRKPELVLHNPVLEPRRIAQVCKPECFTGFDCGRFFTINRLSPLHRFFNEPRALKRTGCIKKFRCRDSRASRRGLW
jgi:hypothetical protein